MNSIPTDLAISAGGAVVEESCCGEILRAFGLGHPLSLRRIAAGEVNKSFIAHTASQILVIRIAPARRTLDDMQFQHSFVLGLAERGYSLQVPQPLVTSDGAHYLRIEDRYVSVYKYIEGHSTDVYQPEHRLQIARALAEAHALSAGLCTDHSRAAPLSIDPSWLIESWEAVTMERTQGKESFAKLFAHYAEEVLRTLRLAAARDARSTALIPVHGDWAMANLLFDGAGRLHGVIDFDHAHFDTVAKDLAHFLQYECAEDARPEQLDLGEAKRFLAAYRQFTPLSSAESAAIPANVVLECADALWCKYMEARAGSEQSAAFAESDLLLRRMHWYHKHASDIAAQLAAAT